MPETKMEKFVFNILEETPGILMDAKSNLLECSAEDIAKELDTTSQVIGKVMLYCNDFWERKIKRINGKRIVVYIPKE